MVKWFKSLMTLCLLVSCGLSAEVQVTVNIDASTLSEGAPIFPRVSVRRSESQEVDVSSFQLGGQPLDVQFMGDQSHSSFTIINGVRSGESYIISTYRFRMEGKAAGPHVIPSVSVEVDGLRYKSPQAAFNIQSAQSSGDFRLEAIVEGDEPFFPGRQLTFVYKIYFRKNIELTLQELPAPDSSAFRAVGSQETTTYREGGFYVQEIRQAYQILTPGEYSLPASVIEGFAYEQDFFGRRRMIPPRLRAEGEPVSITVEAFPRQGKPADFNGAVGDFTIQARLISSRKVGVGDKMQLEVSIYGSGELETLSLPEIAEQPGFKGKFRFSDLPPLSDIKGRSKEFVVELRPLSEEIKAIPEISFSFFNPKRKVYSTVKSAPISIVVSKLDEVEAREKKSEQKEAATAQDEQAPVQTETPWQGDFAQVQRIRIAGNYELSRENLKQDPLKSPNVLYVIPIGVLLLLLQASLRQTRRKKVDQEPQQNSQDLYLEALKKQDKAEVFYSLIEQALLQRLYEAGQTETLHRSAAELPRGGLLGDVRSFLTLLEAQRFSGKKLLAHEQVMDKAKKLFDRIR